MRAFFRFTTYGAVRAYDREDEIMRGRHQACAKRKRGQKRNLTSVGASSSSSSLATVEGGGVG
jgi:hypothetical protein